MRKWNKLLALVLAMVMVFGLAATSFAAEADGDKKEDTTATTPAEGEDKTDDVAPAEGEDKTDDDAPAEGEDKTDNAAPAEGEDKTDNAAPAEGEDKTDDAPAADAYADVADWAKEAVASIVEKKLMDMGETGFNPTANMTRVDLVVALYRHAGTPSVEGIENSFTDIAELTDEQQAAIVWANDKKVVTGVSPKFFNPTGEIQRQQIAVILYRYAQPEAVAEDNLAVFTNDITLVNEWALDALNWAVANKYITGISPKSLDPLGTAQRQQVAVILSRYIAALDAAEPAAPAEGETTPAEDAAPAEGEATPAESEAGTDTSDSAKEPADGKAAE